MLEQMYKEATKRCNKGDAWEFERHFADVIIEACLDAVCECDPSPQLSLQEPYRTVFDTINDYFESDL